MTKEKILPPPRSSGRILELEMKKWHPLFFQDLGPWLQESIPPLPHESLFFDFMYEVFLPKYKSSDYFISNSIFFSFMNEKTEQELEVAKWSEASKKKIISKLKAYFIDSGYLIKDGNDYRLVKPIVPGDILENIKDNYKPVVLEALLQI